LLLLQHFHSLPVLQIDILLPTLDRGAIRLELAVLGFLRGVLSRFAAIAVAL
jgi:hypothetical protein